MKISISVLLIFSLIAPFTIFAQLSLDAKLNLPTADQYKKITKQEVWVKLHTNEKVEGILYNVTQESLILIPKDDYIDRYSHFVKLVKEDQRILKVDAIHNVRINKGNGGKGFLIGLGVGAVMGYAIGGASTGYEFAAVGAGGLVGGLLGLIVGSISSKSYKPKNKIERKRLKKKAITYGY